MKHKSGQHRSRVGEMKSTANCLSLEQKSQVALPDKQNNALRSIAVVCTTQLNKVKFNLDDKDLR